MLSLEEVNKIDSLKDFPIIKFNMKWLQRIWNREEKNNPQRSSCLCDVDDREKFHKLFYNWYDNRASK